MATLKVKYPFKLCNKKGFMRSRHWSPDHNPDGTLKDGVFDSETSLSECKNKTPVPKSQTNNQTLPGFNSTLLSGNDDTLCCNVASTAEFELLHGPLVDSSSPYSAVGQEKLNILRMKVSYIDRKPKPVHLSKYHFWRFGSGSHSSARRKILSSISLILCFDDGKFIIACHLVAPG